MSIGAAHERSAYITTPKAPAAPRLSGRTRTVKPLHEQAHSCWCRSPESGIKDFWPTIGSIGLGGSRHGAAGAVKMSRGACGCRR